MCGICGFYSKKNISSEVLEAMNQTLYHRGPDSSGKELYQGKQGYTIGLAHRRLAIQDLSELGHQPMHSADGRISLVFNGEIYNFHEIREELGEYPFCSHCDTVVIIASFLKWGIRCVDKFLGMFAFALYDREDESLYLVRDRIGKKPLYYHLDEKNITFASELKPFLKLPGFQKEIRQEILKRYLTMQYINAPDTIFENVYQVKPGMVLRFKMGEKKEWKYWDIAERYQELKGRMKGTFGEAKEELDKKLNQSVRQRMISDVPLGTFLSGGYDSSLVTAIAQANSSQPVKTFSIGFENGKYNEAVYAKEVANYLGTDHTELYINERDMFAMIDTLVDYYDEPFADSSQIPSMLVSGLAKEKVTVALSGDGGDELFCGYNNYKMLAQMEKLDSLGEITNKICELPGIKQGKLLEKFPMKVQIVARNRDKRFKVQPFDYYRSKRAERILKAKQMEYRYLEESRYQSDNWQIRRMLLDMETYLPGDILTKVDRGSMKYSLETRCPILDKEIIEYSFTLPHDYKYHEGIKKYILKELAYDYIPKQLLERPKTGFSVPLDQWLQGPLKEELLAFTEESFLKRQGIFWEKETKRMIEEYLKQGVQESGSGKNISRIVWAYFIFQKWYERYM